jgi:hypothetical protein
VVATAFEIAMREHSLGDLRRYIEQLATADGSYSLVCARYGDSPVPADGLRFADRTTARAAARATARYRARLRQYDERLPCYDIVVSQEVTRRQWPTADRPTTTPRESDEWTLSPRVVGASAERRSARVRFCHRVATAVFDVLSDHECHATERAVLSAYDDLTESTADPDSLCVQLLERMALVLDEQLPLAEQAAVVTDAADRLPETTASTSPVATTLSVLEAHGLLDEYAVSPPEPADDTRGRRAHLSGYSLAPQDECLPILPIVVELARHRTERSLPSLTVATSTDGWELTLGPATTLPRATVPINAEV